jgi:hypothetical protein
VSGLCVFLDAGCDCVGVHAFHLVHCPSLPSICVLLPTCLLLCFGSRCSIPFSLLRCV